MGIKQAFSLALKSLLSSKMRSFLTMLGIIVGVAAVVTLVSLMSGMTRGVVEQVESMGANLLQVMLIGRGGNRTVTPDDMQALVEKNPETLPAVSPAVQAGNITVKYGTENQTTSLYGVNETFADIRNVEIEQGRFLEYIDVERRQKVCVVGSYIVQNLFDGGNALGQTLKINNDVYTIVGVTKSSASDAAGSDDDRVFVPYTLARSFTRNANVNSYVFSAVSKDTADAAMTAIKEALFKVYNSEDAYRVMSMASVLDTINQMTGMMTSVLVGIAAISLLVGGIGVMNIMLVSVTERTREIGVRKSLGATPWDILSQFSVEAITTSVIGGLIGIGLGVAASYGMASAISASSDMTIYGDPSFSAILLAFGVSAGIGVAFGYFPARKASKLNPIEALRYD
jgi:putative ABC transport system permease protein